jgi:hypothetical protein
VRRLRTVAAAFVLCVLPAAGLHGATGQEPPPPPSERPPPVTWRGSVEWIAAVRVTQPADTPLNPGNALLRIPQLWTQAEVRPHLRVDLGSRLTAVARPRGVANAQAAWAGNLPRADAHDTSANWTELYVNWRPVDLVQVTYGLQNFQWGPAELLAPSNRLFHETGVFRDQLYYVRGRHLLRVNLSPGRDWSAIAIAEVSENGEAPFIAREPFRRQGQVKVEYSAPTGRGYIGGTFGGREGGRPWFGEYASVSLTDGLSAYVDATHARGSRAWYPVAGADGWPAFVRRDLDSDAWRTLAVAGLRYTFVAGPDLRIEAVHQDAGYTKDELALSAAAAGVAASREDLAPYVAPGLELTGRRLALVSLRVPDLPPHRHLMLHGRYLRSLTDGSGVAFLTASLDAADAVVLFASASLTHGSQTAEFSRLARGGAVFGTVWTW